MTPGPGTDDEKEELRKLLTLPPDPVLGLEDVALGRWVPAPTTVYLIRNNDRSGVMGVLYPEGEFLLKARSTTGSTIQGRDDDKIPYEGQIVWDGAAPSPVSEIPLGFRDLGETEEEPVFKEHSKGLLLGDYPNNGELWKAIGEGREMR